MTYKGSYDYDENVICHRKQGVLNKAHKYIAKKYVNGVLRYIYPGDGGAATRIRTATAFTGYKGGARQATKEIGRSIKKNTKNARSAIKNIVSTTGTKIKRTAAAVSRGSKDLTNRVLTSKAGKAVSKAYDKVKNSKVAKTIDKGIRDDFKSIGASIKNDAAKAKNYVTSGKAKGDAKKVGNFVSTKATKIAKKASSGIRERNNAKNAQKRVVDAKQPYVYKQVGGEWRRYLSEYGQRNKKNVASGKKKSSSAKNKNKMSVK